MIHSILKQSTQGLHTALESKLRVLLGDEITVDQYATVQKKFYGFYEPIEAQLLAIQGWDDPEFALRDRLKLPRLIADLASLDVHADQLGKLPICEHVPNLQSVPEALGCLYVLEGSTLGGQIISRHLQRVWRLDQSRGCSFFNSYGNEVGRMWSSYLKILERHSERHRDDDVVVRSACQTFACLDQWFTDAA